MGLLNKFFGNTRKPVGFLGRIMVNGMNGGSHTTLAKWALNDFEIRPGSKALDIGCGGGANIARLLNKCQSVTGIDYSTVSVAKSQKYNRQAIKDGRCIVMEGNVNALPFEDNRFDIVTAFETIYFWPDIENAYRQVRRVLKDGGRFLIVNESDGDDPAYKKWEKIVEGMYTYTAAEIESNLKNAGFTDIQITRNEKNFLKVVAVK